MLFEFLILLTIGTRADRGGDEAGGKARLPKGNVPLSYVTFQFFLFCYFLQMIDDDFCSMSRHLLRKVRLNHLAMTNWKNDRSPSYLWKAFLSYPVVWVSRDVGYTKQEMLLYWEHLMSTIFAENSCSTETANLTPASAEVIHIVYTAFPSMAVCLVNDLD